jgi:hypothetical protein
MHSTEVASSKSWVLTSYIIIQKQRKKRIFLYSKCDDIFPNEYNHLISCAGRGITCLKKVRYGRQTPRRELSALFSVQAKRFFHLSLTQHM